MIKIYCQNVQVNEVKPLTVKALRSSLLIVLDIGSNIITPLSQYLPPEWPRMMRAEPKPQGANNGSLY